MATMDDTDMPNKDELENTGQEGGTFDDLRETGESHDRDRDMDETM